MLFLFERMEHMPKQYTPEVKGRAVTYALERLGRYKSVYGVCQDLAPKLNIGAETLRRWVVQAQAEIFKSNETKGC